MRRRVQPRQPCGFVLTWEPLTQCGAPALWRYPGERGGYHYLCDEHAEKHLSICEEVPAAGLPHGVEQPQ